MVGVSLESAWCQVEGRRVRVEHSRLVRAVLTSASRAAPGPDANTRVLRSTPAHALTAAAEVSGVVTGVLCEREAAAVRAQQHAAEAAEAATSAEQAFGWAEQTAAAAARTEAKAETRLHAAEATNSHIVAATDAKVAKAEKAVQRAVDAHQATKRELRNARDEIVNRDARITALEAALRSAERRADSAIEQHKRDRSVAMTDAERQLPLLHRELQKETARRAKVQAAAAAAAEASQDTAQAASETIQQLKAQLQQFQGSGSLSSVCAVLGVELPPGVNVDAIGARDGVPSDSRQWDRLQPIVANVVSRLMKATNCTAEQRVTLLADVLASLGEYCLQLPLPPAKVPYGYLNQAI